MSAQAPPLLSLTDEYQIQNLLRECMGLFDREQKDAETTLIAKIDYVNKLLTANIRQTFDIFSQEVIVKFAEVAVEVPARREYADKIITAYFQRMKDPNQFYIRALLVKARLTATQGHLDNKKGEQLVGVLKEAILYVSKALDIISGGPEAPSGKGKDSKGDPKAAGGTSNKQKYGFLIYNASNCVYRMIRFMLKQNWQKNFSDIVERIYKLFQEIDEPDHNWRCRFTWLLYQCVYDADRKQDAYKILDQLWQKTKGKNCDFQEALFRLRVHISKENPALAAVIKKDLEGPSDQRGWRVLEVLQRMKSGAVPEQQIEKDLMNVINSISSAVLTGNEQSANTLSPVMQQRLAQAGRVALQFGQIAIANSVTNFLNKVRQPSQKAMVLNEYNKAQILIKVAGPEVDNKTGMKLNAVQLKLQQIQRRSEALKLLDKVMIINRRLNDADLIYEGCILIWNACLPLMNPTYRDFATKAFEAASLSLEQIDSTDHGLRVKLHLEIAKAYFGNESMFFKVEEHLSKALALDNSIPLNKLAIQPGPEEDASLFQRPYDRYLQSLRHKALLKKNNYDLVLSDLDKITMDLWNVMGQKSQNTRIDVLQKCLGTLVTIQQLDYDIESAKERHLVEDEIQKEILANKHSNLQLLKRKKLIAAEIAELAFEWQINQVAEKASEFVIADKWDHKKAIQMVLAQAKCYYFLAQIKIDSMINDNLEVAFAQPVPLEEEEDSSQKPTPLTPEEQESVLARKRKIFQYFTKGVELAQSIEQSWLVFNGAIYIWNNFLHIFKNPINDAKLLPQISAVLKKFFESMMVSLKDLQRKQILTYDFDTKIQVFANIGLVYARQMQNLKQPDEVAKICEALLVTDLSPHTRKLVNSIKSRNVKGGAPTQKPGAQPPKGGAPAKGAKDQVPANNTDVFLFDIVSKLEIIKNSAKGQTEELVKECFKTLENWKAKQNDETELELHAELWAKLAGLALKEDSIIMSKYALRCVEYSLSLSNETSSAPTNRLRWYSLAEYLYSQALCKMVNPETQEVESCQKLLFAALGHAVEAANKGFKCNNSVLVLDASKQVWNISSRLQESALNRKNLINPIFLTLGYLKAMKEKSQTDLLLLLSQLLFKSALENQEYKIGENTADMLFELVPKNMQRPLWEAKMVFMSRQGKNELQAISNMKQADASLQAKLWVKLARVSTQHAKQSSAYNKAIEILKKENSVQIVEVLIEYAEWQIRAGKEKLSSAVQNLLLASDYLIDIEIGDENEEEEIQEDKGTVFSRSTRGKKSQHSSSQRSKQSKSKKPLQKKSVASSSKSKGSRMNRTGRIAKTIKSKNTKSVFTQREEEGQPESLNCAHYERLFRIHTMLAMIANRSEDRIRYALDAKEFLMKVLEVSYRTINTMEQNAAKYNSAIDEKKDSAKQSTEEFVRKYKMPSSIEEWIKLTLTKDFLERVKNYEDYNFMGVFLFDKAELTYTYLHELISIFQGYSFHIQTLPLFFFLRFLAKQIISNPTLVCLADLKFAATLRKCGFTKDFYDSILQSSKYKLTDQDRKSALAKTQSLKFRPIESSNEQTIQLLSNSLPSPNIVKSFADRTYQIWIQIACEYLELGEIFRAKQLLTEAVKHCKILGDANHMSRCLLNLMRIAYFEGEFVQAVNLFININKICREIKVWEPTYRISFRILSKLCKLADLETFSSSMRDVISRVIKECETGQKFEGQSHEHELLDLKQLLMTIHIYEVRLALEKLLDEPTAQLLDDILSKMQALENLSSLSSQVHTLLSEQYQDFCKIARHIIVNLEQGTIDVSLPKNESKLVRLSRRILKVLLRMEEQVLYTLKYSSIGVDQATFFSLNPLITVHHDIRLTISRIHILEGIYKRATRFNLLTQTDQETLDEVHEFEPLRKYMEQLNMQIQKALCLVPKRLDSFESAISILSNMQSRLDKNSYQYCIWGVEMSAAKRNLAKNREDLNHVWSAGQDLKPQHPYATDSLSHILSFVESHEAQVEKVMSHPHAYYYAKRLALQMVQNTGQLVPEKSIQYLLKYQHYSFVQQLQEFSSRLLESNHKYVAYSRLFRNFNTSENPAVGQQLSTNPLYLSLNKYPSYSQCLKILPHNHLMVVLSFNMDKSELYFGVYLTPKPSATSPSPAPTLVIKKRSVSAKEYSAYKSIVKTFNYIRLQLGKIPIDQAEIQKYNTLINESNQKAKSCMKQLEELCSWWSSNVKALLETKKEEPVAALDPKDAKKGAKDAGKASKKGGKDQLGSYESPLVPSPSGIESVTLLVDTELYELPFEHLSALSTAPSIGRDPTLFSLCRKLNDVGFKPQINNSSGFGAANTKFISYDYKDEKLNGEEALFNQIAKQAPSFKFQGISSSKRIPSVGEYQKLVMTGSILHVYGYPSFINTLKPRTLLNSVEINKTKLLILTDSVNAQKSVINKFEPVNGSESLSPAKQLQGLLFISSLMNASCLYTRWCPGIESVMSGVKKVYKNMSEDIYVGGAIKKMWENEGQPTSEGGVDKKYLEKLMFVYNGPSVVRV